MSFLNFFVDILRVAELGVILDNAWLVGLTLWVLALSSHLAFVNQSEVLALEKSNQKQKRLFQVLIIRFRACLLCQGHPYLCRRTSTKKLSLQLLFATSFVYTLISSGLSHWASMPVP